MIKIINNYKNCSECRIILKNPKVLKYFCGDKNKCKKIILIA